jgi:hypothetical protein
LAIADHQDIVGVIAGRHEVISLVEFFKSGFADCSQDSECWEEGCRALLSAESIKSNSTPYLHGSHSAGEGALCSPLVSSKRLQEI